MGLNRAIGPEGDSVAHPCLSNLAAARQSSRSRFRKPLPEEIADIAVSHQTSLARVSSRAPRPGQATSGVFLAARSEQGANACAVLWSPSRPRSGRTQGARCHKGLDIGSDGIARRAFRPLEPSSVAAIRLLLVLARTRLPVQPGADVQQPLVQRHVADSGSRRRGQTAPRGVKSSSSPRI